jgi:hypothetical protein
MIAINFSAFTALAHFEPSPRIPLTDQRGIMQRPHFACPQCGNTALRLLGVKRDRSLTWFAAGENESEPSITYALQCECGVAFTETVRRSEDAKHCVPA